MIRSNSRKFPMEFNENSEISVNSQREFRVAWIPRIPGLEFSVALPQERPVPIGAVKSGTRPGHREFPFWRWQILGPLLEESRKFPLRINDLFTSKHVHYC